VDLEQLLDMKTDELVELLGARQRRRCVSLKLLLMGAINSINNQSLCKLLSKLTMFSAFISQFLPTVQVPARSEQKVSGSYQEAPQGKEGC